MAVNLIDSNDIQISQIGNNIELQIDSDIKGSITQNTSDIADAQQDITNLENGNVYSTNEVNTGKIWVDNKPIYRKVVNGTLPSLQPSSGGTAEGNVAHGISNFDSIVSISGRMLYSNTWLEFPILSSNQKMTAIYRVTSTNIIMRASDSWGGTQPVQFIIEYTKTTD